MLFKFSRNLFLNRATFTITTVISIIVLVVFFSTPASQLQAATLGDNGLSENTPIPQTGKINGLAINACPADMAIATMEDKSRLKMPNLLNGGKIEDTNNLLTGDSAQYANTAVINGTESLDYIIDPGHSSRAPAATDWYVYATFHDDDTGLILIL